MALQQQESLKNLIIRRSQLKSLVTKIDTFLNDPASRDSASGDLLLVKKEELLTTFKEYKHVQFEILSYDESDSEDITAMEEKYKYLISIINKTIHKLTTDEAASAQCINTSLSKSPNIDLPTFSGTGDAHINNNLELNPANSTEVKTKFNFKKYFINKTTNANVEPGLKDDYIVKSVGAFGLWHFLVCCAASTPRITAMWNLFSILFLTSNTEFVCVKFKDNITRDADNSTCYENCTEYLYYGSIFERNLISEYDLVCDRAWLASMAQVVMMFGCLTGIIVIGWFSDRYGRKKALILSTATVVIFMFVIPFSINYLMFICLRFILGLASGGIMSASVVYVIEIVGPQYREVTTATLVPDFMSQIFAPLFAYFTSTWNQFLLGFGIASLLIFFLLIRLPETPRWLMANGKIEEVVDVMTKAAIFNKRSTDGIRENVMKTMEELRVNAENTPNFTYLDLFRNLKLTLITIAAAAMWFVSGMCFYGIMQYVTLLGSNLYLVTFVMALSDVPTVFIAFASTKILGRKIPAMSTHIIIGVTMIILIFVQHNALCSTILGAFGKAVANVSFSIMYLYVPELYPTAVRNMGLSFNLSASKFGAMVAPFVANTKPIWLASLIFGVISFIVAGCGLILPETKGKKMQDTFDE